MTVTVIYKLQALQEVKGHLHVCLQLLAGDCPAWPWRNWVTHHELLFSSCDRELWPMTLTFKPDLHMVKMNQWLLYQDY